jgi:alkanesulfonate monooxygenase SsuD/methylene tetrahydromethanopterin reductase-like flavin-dependent oxidoreductase (luciferase family)
MRVDVLLLQNAPAAELVERARRVEAMGFGCVWIADHFVNPYAPEDDWLDAWTLLGSFAVATSRVRLGPLVSAPALRNPALLALQAVTVDHLSDGRLEVGVGAGGAPLDFEMMGVPHRSPREQLDRLTETVEILDSLLAAGRVKHDGRYYTLEARVRPPVQQPRPPLVVGALAPGSLRVAAARADAVSTYPVRAGGRISAGDVASGDDALATIRARMEIVDRECERIGRDPATLRRSLLTFFGVRDALLPPDEFAEWAEPYRRIGITEFVVYWPANGDEDSLAALGALTGT